MAPPVCGPSELPASLRHQATGRAGPKPPRPAGLKVMERELAAPPELRGRGGAPTAPPPATNNRLATTVRQEPRIESTAPFSPIDRHDDVAVIPCFINRQLRRTARLIHGLDQRLVRRQRNDVVERSVKGPDRKLRELRRILKIPIPTNRSERGKPFRGPSRHCP